MQFEVIVLKTCTVEKNTKKNKLGVKNSLVNNIKARKEKGLSRSKKKSTVSKKAYTKMEKNWKK
ncbi:hypothetical protein BH11BAC5_BH11BAC5_13430 [soil metagenome]